MKDLAPYLTFPGNCREAMTFYADCLGGQIVTLQTYAESPLDTPDEYADQLFNSELRAEEVCIRASDCLPPYETEPGSNFSLFVSFSDRSEQEKVYQQLAEGGEIIMPLDDAFGMVQDRFEIRWMVALEP